LVSPRWLGCAAFALVASALMVLAGHWQLDRYTARTATNARIDAARAAAPVPLGDLVPPPGDRPGTAGAAPAPAVRWSRVTVTGRYDPDRDVVVRGRNLGGERGFEVLTPLRLADGTAVLVDRGWIAAAGRDARARPALPPAAGGVVTVVGRLAPPESGTGAVDTVDGRREVRRIAAGNLAPHLPYPLYGGHVLRDADSPDRAADDPLVATPSPRQATWQNFGYVVQWWLFAAMTWVGFGWLARREAAARRAGQTPGAAPGPVERHPGPARPGPARHGG
ncbi:MAG TPA: SURF1 family protein, partial [Pilimelia sp.]|nr:SURF1 family protein [Pilimelia sp.]